MEYTAKRFNKEGFITYASNIINGYNVIVKVHNIIKSVAEKMNGKVLNKRFQTEIENELKNACVPASVYITDDSWDKHKGLKIYLDRRDCQINGSTIYFDNEMGYYWFYNITKDFADENGRIVSDKVFCECDKLIEGASQSISEWQDAIDNYDKYNAQLKEAVKTLGNALKGINYRFKPNKIDSYDWESAIRLR